MKSLYLLALLPASFIAGAPADAAGLGDAWPNRPIRMIVTNAPGSSVDTLSRIVALRMGDLLGQQVIVDNRPGAGSVLGMEIGARANPDGYTLVSAPTAAVAVAAVVANESQWTMGLPEVRDAIAAQATEVVTSTPEEFRKLARDELGKYGKVIKSMGLRVEQLEGHSARIPASLITFAHLEISDLRWAPN